MATFLMAVVHSSSFVAPPLSRQACTRASAGSMMSLDRRAALSGAATALLWGVQRSDARVSSALAVDSAILGREESKLSAVDAELATLARQELSDEVALCQARDAVLDAMSAKKDPAEIAELQARVVELQAKESVGTILTKP
jgi:hypothetical protein